MSKIGPKLDQKNEKKSWWSMSDYSLTFNTVQIGKKKQSGKMEKKYLGAKSKKKLIRDKIEKKMMRPRTIDQGQNGNKSWWSMSDYSLTFFGQNLKKKNIQG